MTDDQLVLDFSSKLPTCATPSANAGLSSKTSLDYSAVQEEQTLLRWLEHYLGQRLTFQTMAGKTPALHLAPKGSSNGSYWTRSSSESRKGAVVCSLSEMLETGPIDPRYYLTEKACRGILRRAEKRGKTLPPPLEAALRAVAHTENGK